jgi:hypothetical protein
MSASRLSRVRARLLASALSDGHARRVGVLILVGLVTASCTSMLGIDGDYVQGVKGGSGGAGGKVPESGGSAGDGGAGETGGSSSGGRGTGGLLSGGAGGAGGAADAGRGCGAAAGDCPSGQKCCASADGTLTSCFVPEPAVGCSLTSSPTTLSCDRCPAPPNNAIAVCDANHACATQCIPGYKADGSGACVPSGSGGAGGQGGSGTGGNPPCDYRKCPGLVAPGQPGCTFLSAFPCCKNDGKCGCTYAAAAYCL